jgi:hypothetical protein
MSDPSMDNSYYRRAVRPNELFFVYAPEQWRALASFEAQEHNDAISTSIGQLRSVLMLTSARVR